MNRLSIVCMAALLVMAMSCKKEKDGNEVQGSGFRASLETPTGDSKTHLDGAAVKWNDGDAILVVNGSNIAKEFALQGTAPSEGYADFQSEDATESFYRPVYKAYYPANLYDAETGRVTLPETQTYLANSFGPGFNPMAAQAEGTTLDFRNICGMLELQLTGNCTVSSIRITAKGSEKLWGTGELILTGNGQLMTPALGTLTGGTGTITLNCNNQVTLTSEATKFYFVLPHNSLSSGFDVLLTDNNGKVWKRSASTNTSITQSNIRRMAVQEVTVTEPVVPTVLFSDGCVNCTYTIGGEVSVPSGQHTCEYGVVYCPTSAGHNPTISDSKIVVNTESFSGTKSFNVDLDLVNLQDGVTYYMCAYAIIEGVAYSTEVRTMTVSDVPQPLPSTWANGKNPHPFTVGSGKVVYFSQGNLQYNATGSSATAVSGANVGGSWRFANHQFDIIGADNANAAQTYNGWIDLFGWGTSGYNHGAACYQPWSTSQTFTDYIAYATQGYNLYDGSGTADWGYNTNQNGGTNSWRTLKKDEWCYLINTRTDGDGNVLYGEGKVGPCMNGLIVLPDDWDWNKVHLSSSAPTWVPGSISYSDNNYNYADWKLMEAEGAMFLPAAGSRDGVGMRNVNSVGYYESSTFNNIIEGEWCAWYFRIDNSGVDPGKPIGYLYHGFSVRLVSEN